MVLDSSVNGVSAPMEQRFSCIPVSVPTVNWESDLLLEIIVARLCHVSVEQTNILLQLHCIEIGVVEHPLDLSHFPHEMLKPDALARIMFVIGP